MMEDEENEVAFRSETVEAASPTPITTADMDVIIRGWEEKFAKLTECLREVHMAMERTGSDNQSGGTCSGPGARTAPGNHAGRPRGLPAKV